MEVQIWIICEVFYHAYDVLFIRNIFKTFNAQITHHLVFSGYPPNDFSSVVIAPFPDSITILGRIQSPRNYRITLNTNETRNPNANIRER